MSSTFHFLLCLCLIVPLGLQLQIAAAAASPATLRGQGAAASFDDGDSFELRLSPRRVVTIRLHAIDAPELVQAHGEAAKRALIGAIAGRPVRVDCYKRDPRGRFVCRAWAGEDDLQLRLLQGGHVWHFAMYADEQTARERSLYARAQSLARANRRGLWKQARPMPPWNCRDELRRLRPCR